MKNTILFILLCLGSLLLNFDTYAQITRGAQPGEIYISTEWYMDNFGQIHYAILHSTDNGETFSLKYENTENTPPGEMQVGRVLADATPGALYNYGNNELWVSFEYGENWEYMEDYPGYTSFYSGVNQGLIFKGNNQGFFKSTDYAATFELLPISVTCPFTEVGFAESEFYGIYGEAGMYYNFVHTIDYGQTYSETPIDSAVAFWQIGGYFPQISRGTEPGKLYLVSWWPDYHYKIFHSVDTGYSWIEKYESDFINQYFWEVYYTAGRQPGSFYVMRSTLDPTFNHRMLYIDYSNDYGETFTTYFHDLDSTITSLNPIKKPELNVTSYPNPFKDKATISFQLPGNCNNAVLNIYNNYGILIRQFDVCGKEEQQWDGSNSSGITVKSGLYFYKISSNEFSTSLNKLLILN